ncbi:hypothetical protein CN893_02650 [Bacillus thuringiensis]|nr:hypothetical protein BMT18_28990 [Bacillus thuringiensis serovar aizawai]OXR51835.1 hypothetical protein CCZ40_30440 [Bacillus thuringiensis]PGK06256.1 hypothetical protein CN893_02650 [Bacillus thuringiensis]
MYVEQLRWLLAIPCSKPIHLPPTHFAFLEEGVFLAKMIKSVKLKLRPKTNLIISKNHLFYKLITIIIKFKI